MNQEITTCVNTDKTFWASLNVLQNIHRNNSCFPSFAFSMASFLSSNNKHLLLLLKAKLDEWQPYPIPKHNLGFDLSPALSF